MAGLPFHESEDVKPVPLLIAVEGVARATGEVTPVIAVAVTSVAVVGNVTSNSRIVPLLLVHESPLYREFIFLGISFPAAKVM